MPVPQKKCEKCNINGLGCHCIVEQEMNRIIAINKQWLKITHNANYVRSRLNPKAWLLDTSLQLN